MNKSRSIVRSKKWSILYFAAIIFILWAPQTHAYLDPGTGSYVVQILIGTLFGAAYFFKSFFIKLGYKIRTLFRKESGKKND